jgi:hypothetical protein
MKKKLIFAIAIGFFAVATVFNMNMLQTNDAGDISLEGIAVMAQAQNENGVPLPPVTVYGCSNWGSAIINGEEVSACFTYTSSTPCSQNC